jgi:hypothetical protein
MRGASEPFASCRGLIAVLWTIWALAAPCPSVSAAAVLGYAPSPRTLYYEQWLDSDIPLRAVRNIRSEETMHRRLPVVI